MLARPAVIAATLTSMSVPLTAGRLGKWISRDRQQQEEGRPRRVPYPPILQVSTDCVDEDGKRRDGAGPRRVRAPLVDDAAAAQ